MSPQRTFRGVLTQARWEKCESTETPTTSVSMALNSLSLSLKAMISVGQTKVLAESQMQFIINLMV